MRHDAYRDAARVSRAPCSQRTPWVLRTTCLSWPLGVPPVGASGALKRQRLCRPECAWTLPGAPERIRINAASRHRGVVRHDKQLTPNSSTRRSRRASPAQAGGEQSRMMRAHQIPERVQTATQELSHQALRRHTRKPATWP